MPETVLQNKFETSFSLGEGNTPLVRSVSQSGSCLSFKLESCNPTGSYKDRFIATEMRRLLASGTRACIATSSGNTGSALAAYTARCGITCMIVVNEVAPWGKVAQMQAYGAHVTQVPGFAIDPQLTVTVFHTLTELSKNYSIPLVVSAYKYCPEGMAGVESISGELLTASPNHVFVPVGGGGLYSAIVQGFLARTATPPRVHAVQPEGCLTLVGSYLRGDDTIREVKSTTEISGLSVPSDIDASRGLSLLRQCGGTGIAVSDTEVLAAQKILLQQEGIYSEPAGATAFAGWRHAVREGSISPDEPSICLVTGNGFKDPLSIEKLANANSATKTEAGNLAGFVTQLMP